MSTRKMRHENLTRPTSRASIAHHMLAETHESPPAPGSAGSLAPCHQLANALASCPATTHREVISRLERLIVHHDVCSSIDQHLTNLLVPIGSRRHQRGPAGLRGQVHVGTIEDEHRHHLFVIVASSIAEGSPSKVVLGIDVLALHDQREHLLEISLMCGIHQRCDIVSDDVPDRVRLVMSVAVPMLAVHVAAASTQRRITTSGGVLVEVLDEDHLECSACCEQGQHGHDGTLQRRKLALPGGVCHLHGAQLTGDQPRFAKLEP
mmetsp:Transcript_66256/g.167929  ORF Transcript_66256/g.167929 Transcript_66256/m.167929 type:complete len:264 (+) Transcript_66256:240-1031(+)